MRRTILGIPLLAVVAALAAPGTPAMAAGEDGATWQLQQPPVPPPPIGVGPAPFQVPLGKVGDIEFEAPNRGVLITAGNGPIPPSVYAYNGTGWHLLSTVCGATDGRVAWAGPDDFWTVSDQRTGQQGGTGTNQVPTDDRSLCHFDGGQVVASYALPAGQADSYQPMSGAACSGPNDCWFGGALLKTPPPYGAFHLHWDGQAVTAAPSGDDPVTTDPAHAVGDVSVDQQGFVESVAVDAADPANPAAPDPTAGPYRLHQIVSGAAEPFLPVNVSIDFGLTTQNRPVAATDFGPFRLGSNGSEMWAVGGATSTGRANVVVLHRSGTAPFSQLQLRPLPGGSAPIPYGSIVDDVAAEPGGGAWVTFQPRTDDGLAHVARIEADGTVTDVESLPAAGDPMGPLGNADKVACDAPHDCWMSTTEGWLFHLTDGTSPAPDTDPAFAGVISFRPADQGVAFVPPLDPPLDDSLANQAPPPTQLPPPTQNSPKKKTKVKKQIVSGVRVVPIGRTTSVSVRFRLAQKATVQVVAHRRKKVVARSRSTRLVAGRHAIRMRLNRHRWPTKIDVQARAITKKTPAKKAPAKKSSSSGGTSK